MRTLTVSLALLASLISACANHSKPPPLPKPVVKTIAVVPATNPREYTLLHVSALGFVLPISQSITYIDSYQKAALFNAKLKPHESTLATDFTQCMVSALQGDGYQVEVLKDIKRSAKDPDDVDLDSLPTKADAILQLSFSDVGVFSPRSSMQYLPRVNAHGRLYAKGRVDDLYDEDVIYGVDARAGEKGEIAADPRFAYADFDDLLASQASVQKAFGTGAAKICELMAAQVNEAIR